MSRQIIYEKKTRDIVVRVSPNYLAEKSAPHESRFIWTYTVEIENQGQAAYQLMERFWKIADCHGNVQEVHGKGVVGETPLLQPGKIFRYTSGTPLSAPSGMMYGTYSLQTSDGERFNISIPAFNLDSPHHDQRIN